MKKLTQEELVKIVTERTKLPEYVSEDSVYEMLSIMGDYFLGECAYNSLQEIADDYLLGTDVKVNITADNQIYFTKV